jgi:4a-hydroxytetrahydrobiopterin dehydratase
MLTQEKCLPANDDNKAQLTVSGPEREALLAQIPHWRLAGDGQGLTREFRFKNYYHVMAFVNAVAWIANKEAHHPDLEVSYGRVLVRYTTHDLGGLSRNDFVCAAKVDALLAVGDFGPVLA